MALTDATGDQGNQGAWPPTASPTGAPPPGGVFQINGVWYGADGNPVDTTPTYSEKHFYSGPEGPGYYAVGPDGMPIGHNLKPDSSGGGGSTTIVNASTGGSKFMVMYGPEGYGTYEVSTGTPILIGLKTDPNAAPVNPADRDGNGLDDSTNLALGVYPDKNSSTGYAYFGGGEPIPVYPNGADARASGATYGGGANGAPNLVNGKYIWDPVAKKFVIAPGLETPASSSGGGSYTISGPKVSSYSGGGGSSASDAAQAAAQAAAYAQQTQMQKDAQAFTASQNALDRAQKDAQFQANYGLSVAQFNAQQAAQAKQQKAQDLKDFGNAVSDVDPAQFAAFLYANGFPAGGTIANRIAEGGTAISANALVRAAGLLDSIRNGNQATQYGGGYGGGLGNAGGGTPVPGGAATGATGGLGNTGGTGTPVLPSTQANQGAIDPNIAANIAANQQGQADQAYAADKAATLAWYNPANWTEVPGPDLTSGMRYMKSTLTGETVPIGVWTDMIQNNMEPSAKETQLQTFWGGASVTPDSGVSYGYNPHYTAKPVDSLGQVSGVSSQTIDPYGLNYTGPVAGMPYGNDNIQRPLDSGWIDTTGNLANDNIQRAIPQTTVQAVLPQYARGGLAQGPYISGDSLDNRPNPELNIPTPMGNHVIPLRQMPRGLAQQMMANLPRHAEGTVQDLNSSWLSSQSYNPFNDPFARFMPANAVTQPATTAGSSTTTTPSTPVSSPASPAPAPAVSSTSTGLGNTSPTTSQTSPTQPATTQPAPTNAQGQTIQQPTAPAPVTGGLGSITDIVNSGTTTPTSQALLDEILKWRQGQEVLPVNPLSLDFQNLDPYTQQIIYNQRQTKYGIPVAAQQYEVNKYRIPGASRGSLAGGLAW